MMYETIIVPDEAVGSHMVTGPQGGGEIKCEHVLLRWVRPTAIGPLRVIPGRCSRPCAHGVVLHTREFDGDKAHSGHLFVLSQPYPTATR